MLPARRAVLLSLTTAAAFFAAACDSDIVAPVADGDFSPTLDVVAPDPIWIGAGDIGECSSNKDELVANKIESLLVQHPNAEVFTAGDNAYPNGTLQQYLDCYGPSWGRFKDRTWATLGNHEYNTPNASPSFDYFNVGGEERIGPRGKGYYSLDRGGWHIVMLNSNTGAVPISAGSAQEQWLRQDLAATDKACILAVFHHPRFYSCNSGTCSGSTTMAQAWKVLYEFGADLIISGHRHVYERFAPQDPNAKPDPNGIREFVVGTGGEGVSTYSLRAANSEVIAPKNAFGVIKLTLRPDAYDWNFVPIDGVSFTDSGTASCNTQAQAPSVTISAPVGGATFSAGTSIAFTGSAVDAEDGNLTASLVWSSSLDGSLGTGGSFSTSALSVGTHTITARVTDSDGQEGSAAILLTVNRTGSMTLNVRVSGSSDDAEEATSGKVDLTSSDLELTFDGGIQQVGMRFNALTIPRGAAITNATIQFQVDEANSEATSLTIRGQAADNAPTFTKASGNISSRIQTGSSVAWSPVPWTTVGQAGPDQQTPNLASILQEIVNRPGWSSGNSVVILITGTGRRTAESYNGVPAAAPLLHVDYVVGP